jgi:hypothetical protein
MAADDKVTPFMHELCQMDRFGGRCTRLDRDSWVATDVQQWTDDQATALRGRFPSINARIVANRNSLSGFSIALRVERASVVWTSLLVCAVLVAAGAAIARAIQ